MLGSSSRPGRVFAVVGVAVALVAAGAGIAVAVNEGTAGELNYQRETFTLIGTNPSGFTNSTRKVNCVQGRHVTGGGFESLDASGGASDGRPYDGPDSDTVPDDGWAVSGEIYGENTGRITVYAICDD